MDITKFKFPELTGADMAFPTMGADPTLLKEARDRGFYNGDTPYNTLFSNLFYSGGSVVFKEGLDDEYIEKVWTYLKSFMGSWEPKHQEKEAIAALLLSEIARVEEES